MRNRLSIWATRARDSRAGPALAHAAFALGVSLTLMSPMLLTGRTFGADWTNHLWLMYAQSDAISHGGPSLFLHADSLGIFYPHYAFYGGTLYASGGALSVLLGGHVVVAYLAMWLFAFLLAYGGMLWLSFQIGLDGWRAHAAPVVLLTSAYFITNALARGVLPELIATAAIPLLLASTFSILRSSELKFGPCAALVMATVIFTGSHNLTLIWGTLIIGALALAGIAAIPSLGRVSVRKALTIAGLGALGIAVNAWFLFPDLAYSQRTSITGVGPFLFVDVSDWFDSPANLFAVLRSAPAKSTTPNLDTQLPVFIFAWGIVAGVLSLRFGVRGRVMRAIAGTTAVLALFLGLLMMNWPWDFLPKTLRIIQFTYRLESYVLIAVALLVALLLRSMRHWDARGARFARPVQAALVVVLALGFGQAVAQGWGTHSHGARGLNPPTRSGALASPHRLPATWYAGGDYRDRSGRLVAAPADVQIDPDLVKKNRAAITVASTAPEAATNIAAGAYLVQVTGARQVGHDTNGYEVIAPVRSQDGQPATVVVKPRNSPAVVVGRWVSMLAILTVLIMLLLAGYRSAFPEHARKLRRRSR